MKPLLLAKLWMIKNWVTRMSYGDALKTLAFGALGAVLFMLLYAGFVRVLAEVRAVELVGGLLVVKLIAMTFLTMFLMMIFSSTLASFSTLFFARDLSFLMYSPLAFRSVFVLKAVETSFFSSWMVILAMLPFLMAYAHIYQLGGSFFALLALLTLPFALTACALGVLLSLGLMCVFPSKRVREVMVMLGIIVGCGLYVLFRWLEPEKLMRPDSIEIVLQYIVLLEAPVAPYLPSWWMTSAVTGFLSGRWVDLMQNAALLFMAASILSAVMIYLAEKAYYLGWTRAQEAGRRATETPLGEEWRWAPALLGRRVRPLLGKDIIVFLRDPGQWSQFLLLSALMAVYLLSVIKLPADTPYLKILVAFLNIGMVGFVVASVALRFVYPAISLEGKSWWSLRSAPLSLWTVFWEKFFMGFVPLAIMSVGLVAVSNYYLGADRFLMTLSLATALVMAFVLCGMGVGFGALFPRFQVENVAQIEASPGGLFFMVCALFYVAATLALESMWVRMYYFMVARGGVWRMDISFMVAAALVLLNVSAFTIPFVGGKLSLERRDV